MSAYLQIFKNRDPYTYNYTVLKGEDLYGVNIIKGEKMRWLYMGKIDKKTYSINGELIKTPPLKTIVILQRMLKPEIKESFIEFNKWKKLNEFERELDPLEKMNIGIDALYPWERENLGGLATREFFKYDESIKFLRDTELAPEIIRGLRNQPKWTIEYQVHALNNLIKHNGKADLKDLMPTRPIYEPAMRRIFRELEKRGVIKMKKEGRKIIVFLNIGKYKYKDLI